MEDQCPVCKSDRYLNPKLRLLVSACYHKMCESCIDRLFTLGPAPCPICNKTLRKLAFTPQTFEDLTVEKEVAVRRRIAKDFNKKREDFPDLRVYNDYLEMVEDITFNLINEIDVPQTEARIANYRSENAALIEANIQRDESYAQTLLEQEEYERRQREDRARELARLEEEERQGQEAEKRLLIERLENSTSDKEARKLIAKTKAELAKKQAAARDLVNSEKMQSFNAAKALRDRAAASKAQPDVPHVAIQDDYYAYSDRFTLRERYNDPMSDAVRQDREGIMRAGGYRVDQAWERAIRSAVAGLDLQPLRGLSPLKSEANSFDTGPQDIVMASA